MSIFSDLTDKIDMKKCPKGHLYNSLTHVDCPFCNKIEEFSEKIEEFKKTAEELKKTDYGQYLFNLANK